MTNGETSEQRRADGDLVAAARKGSREAFGELVTRYQDRVYNAAYRLTGRRDDASEIAQEAFLKAFKAFRSFRGESGFYTWLFRIALNEVKSRARFKAVRPAEVSPPTVRLSLEKPRLQAWEPAAAGGDPVEAALASERCELVQAALGRLEAHDRAIIVLRDIEGRDYAEVAEILDVPTGTVKSRLHRARMALKDLLAPTLHPQADKEMV